MRAKRIRNCWNLHTVSSSNLLSQVNCKFPLFENETFTLLQRKIYIYSNDYGSIVSLSLAFFMLFVFILVNEETL